MKQILFFSILFYSVLISKLTPVPEKSSTFKFTYPPTYPKVQPQADSFPNTDAISNDETILDIPVLRAPVSFMPPIKDTLNNPATPYPGAMTIRPQDVAVGAPIIYMTNGLYWSPIVANTQGGVADTLFVANNLYVTFDEEGRQVLHSSLVTTVAELRNVTTPQTGLIYMSTDMGGGIWLWDDTAMTADNTGTILKLATIDTGRLVRQYSGAINCQWFDIRGDSVTDNLANFIAMFTAMGEGHSFYLPAGMYMVSCSEVLGDIIIPSYTHFFGEGMGITVIKWIDNCSAGVTMTANMFLTEDQGTSVTIENLTIDGNKDNQSWLWNASAGYGLGIRSNTSTVRNVEIHDVTANCTGVPSSGIRNVVFENLYLHTSGKKAIHTGASEGLRIINCTIDDVFEGVGIHQGLKGVQVIGNRISHCYTAINLGNSAVHPYAWDYTVTGNILKYNYSHMSIGSSFGNVADVDSFHKEAVITGNEMSGSGRVWMFLADNVRFSNNTLREGYIHIANSFNSIVENNTIILKDTVPLDFWDFSDSLSRAVYESVPPHPVAAIWVVGQGATGTSDIVEGDNITITGNQVYIDTAILDYGISVHNTRRPKIIKNEIFGTAQDNTIRLWEHDGTATIEQESTPDMRIEAIIYPEGFSNAKEFQTNTDDLPVKARKMQKVFDFNMKQMRYATTGAVLNPDGTLLTPPVWSNPGEIVYTNGTGAHFKNNLLGGVTRGLLLQNDFSADQSGVALDFDVANSEQPTGRIINRTNIADDTRDFLFQVYNGSSLVTGMTLLGNRTLSLAQGLTAVTNITSPTYYGSSSSGGDMIVEASSNATKGYVRYRYTSSGAETMTLRLENNVSAASTAASLGFDVFTSDNISAKIRAMYEASDNASLGFFTFGSSLQEAMRILGNRNIGFAGITAPTARLHLPAVTTAAGTGSLKINEGTRLTTPEDGTINYVANNLEFTEGSVVYILTKTLTATAALNFGSTAAQTSSDLTIAVTGAAVGDAVSLGIPATAVNANSTFTAYVSATDVVTVKFNNYSAAPIDPASATFRVSVLKY